jgi:hypothetical protein
MIFSDNRFPLFRIMLWPGVNASAVSFARPRYEPITPEGR